jgi:excisionase family DNA binding protein
MYTAKPFLTVKEVALLLNCSLRTTYRLINTGVINSVNLGERKTIIRRIDIDALFTVQKPTIPKESPNQIDTTPDFTNTYTIGEISKKFKLSDRGVYNLLNVNKVPKQKRGKYTHVPKTIIDELLR